MKYFIVQYDTAQLDRILQSVGLFWINFGFNWDMRASPHNVAVQRDRH